MSKNKDNVADISSGRRQRHVGSFSREHPVAMDMIDDWRAAFTRIGNALGLEGNFAVHFGTEQIEQRAKDAAIVLDYHWERCE